MTNLPASKKQRIDSDEHDTMIEDDSDLPCLTYQQQLSQIILTVGEGEQHLFSTEEWALIEQYQSLDGLVLFIEWNGLMIGM